MKKLCIEDLVVDSFTTSHAGANRGTIAGFQVSAATVCGTYCYTEAYRASCPGGECTNDPDTGGGDTPPHTRNGITCNISCELGQTDCGTCAPYNTCDGPDCWGESQDMRPC